MSAEEACDMCGITAKLIRVRQGNFSRNVCQECLDSCCEDCIVEE